MTGTINWTIQRVKPREGWLLLLLLVAIVACLITAVLEATLGPEDGAVIPAALGGLLLGSVLAKRIDQMQPHLVRLPALYVLRRYAGDKQSGRIMAWESWRKVKRPLWLVQYVKRET